VKLRVLKFGGSSVASPEKIRRVASIVFSHQKECQKIVVVVSAMGNTTDDLIGLAKQVSPLAQSSKYRREMDMLLTTGERISMSLLSMALADLGLICRSFTGSQSGVITDTSHTEARIDEIEAIRIEEHLSRNEIVIVAGFQGVSKDKEVTTLGRGGSDTSAVALGVVLGAEEIFIYTDVSGFFTADPRLVPKARAHKEIESTLAYQAASRGSQVLHPRCLELAAKFKKTLWIKNTFDPGAPGTLIREGDMTKLEGPVIQTLSHQKDLVYFKANAPSTRVLKALTDQGLRPQQVQWTQGVLAFCLPKIQSEQAKSALSIFKFEETPCVSISVLGYGFESHPELSEKVFGLIPEKSLIQSEITPSAISLFFRDEINLESVLNSLHSLI
jgi:aspartate kinase